MAIDRLAARLQSRGQTLSPALRRVGEFIDSNRLEALTKSAAELAAIIGTSDATVIRTVKALGYGGLPDLKRELVAFFGQAATPVANLERTLSDIDAASLDPLETALAQQLAAISTLGTAEAKSQLALATKLLAAAKRVAVFGIGPSRFLAEYMSFSLRRFGVETYALTASGLSLADQLLNLRRDDAVLVLAYGRLYREVAATLNEASRLKLSAVLISDTHDERLTRKVNVVVRVPRGSTDRVATHGATLVALETILMALAATSRARALAQLARLNDLRDALRATGKETRRS